METMTLKAVATVTDAGTFTAVISTEDHDREGDVVSADALVIALKAWNRPIPLTWHHSTKAEDVFGAIDPESARAENAEVVVDGTVDLESERGKQAWPLMKAGVIGFSYGYLVPDGGAVPNTKGGRDISALDVFEVTGTITPMNNGTRVVSTKAWDELQALQERLTELEATVQSLKAEPPETLEPKSARSDRELRERSRQAVLEIQSDGASLRKPPEVKAEEPPPDPGTHLDLKRASRRVMLELLTGGDVA